MNKKNINLNISTETICYIVTKAHEFHAKEGVTFPEKIKDSENEYDWAQILADHEDDLTFLEMKSVIYNLEPDQRIELLALFYMGRGDFSIEQWNTARNTAKNNMPTKLAEYLFSKPQLSDHLEEALNMLGFSCS